VFGPDRVRGAWAPPSHDGAEQPSRDRTPRPRPGLSHVPRPYHTVWYGHGVVNRRDWLDVGLRVLAEEGAPALTVERLSGRLGVTKGSFYHHFKGMGGFKADLLAHFEAAGTTGYVERAGGSARERLELLVDRARADEEDRPPVEPALRAWAMQDADVRAVQERVDRARIDHLARLWSELGPAEQALPMARLLYLVVVGADHVLPPLGPAALREVYQLALGPRGGGSGD